MKNETAGQVRSMLSDLIKAGLTVKDISRHTELSENTVKVYLRRKALPQRTQGKIITAVRALHDRVVVRREALLRHEAVGAQDGLELPANAQQAFEAAVRWHDAPTWTDLSAAQQALVEAEYVSFWADIKAREAAMRQEIVGIGAGG